jgi:branched-chain amino acid transport system permease protein
MVGSIYTLIVMGVVMIYGVMNVPDFALGAKAMLGVYVAFLFTATFHQAYGVALAVSIVVLAILGLGVERWIFRPLAINGFISAFGLLLVFENFALIVFGSSYRRILSPYDRQVIHIFGASLTMQRLLVVLIAIFLMIALHLFIKFTTIGTAIRAVAQNRRGALVCGIHTERIAGVTMAIRSAQA